MEKVLLAAEAAILALLAAQALLVLFRSLRHPHVVEPLLLALFIGLLGLRSGIQGTGALRVLATIGAVWAGGAFLARIEGARVVAAWTAGSAGFCGLLALAALLGYGTGAPFVALGAFGSTLLACFPIASLSRLWRSSRAPSALATLVCSCIWLAAGAAGTLFDLMSAPVPPGWGLWPLLPVSLCTGWLVFQEGYPSRSGWRGSLPGRGEGEILDASISSRLLASESILQRQGRIIASGFLAMAAAHEFKNTLSGIKAAAQHGLSHPEQGDRCLRLVLEHAEVARDSAIAALEGLSREGVEQPVRIEADRDLAECLRMMRAGFRQQGVLIEVHLPPGVAFRARRSDVEQVLLSLVRNSVDAYGSRGIEPGVVTITASRRAENAVIEIRDSAGGVPPERECMLFRPAGSTTGSTGIGLYLSRQLVAANGGSIEYQPVEGGSLFRVWFPAEEE